MQSTCLQIEFTGEFTLCVAFFNHRYQKLLEILRDTSSAQFCAIS